MADGRYDYIETGSLISIKRNTQGITIPSEEDRLTMHPMDYEEFRWALGDTGLFVTLAFWDKSYAENVLYEKLLGDKLEVNLGYVYENVVAQMLVASGHKLFYYTFPKDEKHNYEIDFLLSQGNKIVPVEVKSSSVRSHVSLDAFCQKYAHRIAQPILLGTKDWSHDGTMQIIPVLLTSFI